MSEQIQLNGFVVFESWGVEGKGEANFLPWASLDIDHWFGGGGNSSIGLSEGLIISKPGKFFGYLLFHFFKVDVAANNQNGGLGLIPLLMKPLKKQPRVLK